MTLSTSRPTFVLLCVSLAVILLGAIILPAGAAARVPEWGTQAESEIMRAQQMGKDPHAGADAAPPPFPGPLPTSVASESPGTAGWQTIMTEGFEGTWPSGDWEDPSGGPTWGPDDYKPHSGGRSAWCAAGGSGGLDPAYSDYPNNMAAWMVYGPFDLSDATAAEMTFYTWFETELEYDWFYLQVSPDRETWSGWGRTSGSSQGSWNHITLDLTNVPGLGNACGDSSVWIAVGFTSDGSLTFDGVFIDDIVLRKNVGTEPPPGTCICESDHPYGDYEWGDMCTLTNSDPYATCTRVHFTRIELGQDAVIRLKRSNGQTFQEIQGPFTANDWWSNCVPGTTVKVELQTGSYTPAWGFCIDEVGEPTTPTCPDAPQLDPIDNADCDATYTVAWNHPNGAIQGTTIYIVQEDTVSNFAHPTEVYRDTSTQVQISGRAAGTYYYRVKAENPDCSSGWGNTRSVAVARSYLPAPSLQQINNPECDCDFTLTWSAIDGAEGYIVEAADNAGFSNSTTFRTDNTSAHISGDCSGRTYYRVYAYNCLTQSQPSNTSSVYVLPAPDLQPISNPECDGEYSVSWSAVDDAQGYQLEEAIDSPSGWSTVYEGTGRSKHFSGKDPARYYYRVRATSPVCNSAWSDPIQSVKVWPIPDRPTLDPIANADCNEEYDVTWSEVDGATWYELQEDEQQGFWDDFVVYDGAETIYRVRSQPGGTYYYRVRACNCRDCGPWSQPTRSVFVLGKPTLLPILSTDCDNEYTLTWTPVEGATSYEIEYADNPSLSPSTLLAPPVSDTTRRVIAPGSGMWYYRVRALTEQCVGEWSNVQSVRVWPVPDRPDLHAIDNGDRDADYEVSWSPVADTEYYELQQADNNGFRNATLAYSGPATGGSYADQLAGTWYYRVRACNCRGCGPWSQTRSVVVPEPAAVIGITASLDGVDNEVIGCFISLPGQGIPVENIFTAQVQQGGSPLSKVEFTLNGETKTDYSVSNGWDAVFDMSELPAGNVLLTVVAYDNAGRASAPMSALIWMVAPPPWHGKPWVLNPLASWSPQDSRYYFTGRVPSNPPLYYQYNVNLQYFGALRNTFSSDINVWETFRIDGLWTYQANGELLAELLSVPLVSRQYPAQPLIGHGGSPAWHASNGYQWSNSWDFKGAKIPVLPRIAFILPPPLPPLEVAVSVDMGFDSSLTIQGRLHNDLRPDQIRITPAANAYAQIDVGLEALGGVLGQGLGIRPEFGIELPLVYDITPPAGQSTIYLDEPCVAFRLKGNIYTKVIFTKFHYGTVTLYSDEWPDGCQTAGAGTAQVSALESPPVDIFLSPSVAADGSGSAMAVWVSDQDGDPDVVDPEVQFAHWSPSGWSAPADLTSNDRFETDPTLTFLSNGKALALWTQNEIPRSQAEQVEDLDQILNEQEIYSSLWNGSSWNAPKRITNDHLADGRATVAAGPDGQAMALWVRDDDGNSATRGDLSIRYSRWLDQNWSAPAVLAANNQASETSPSVAFSSTGEAFAAWVHDSDANAATVDDRYLTHATWDGNGWSAPRVRTDWPAGVLYPRVAYSTDGEPLLIFTVREQDAHGDYYGEGTRDLLWSARHTPTGWELAPVGEHTVAHEPNLAVSPSNQATVTFRGFQGGGADGYGGDVMIAIADLDMVDLEWSEPQYQTQDAARDWQIGAAWEPLSERTLILDQHTDLSGQGSGRLAIQSGVKTQVLQSDLMSFEVPFGVDLSIDPAEITFSNPHPQAGEDIVITATVRNLGLQAADQPFRVVVRRSSPWQVIADVRIDERLPHNGEYDLVVSWIAPGGVDEITITVDFANALDELNEGNNQARKSLGETPAPQFLVAAPAPQGEAIVLAWPVPDTAGIAGYRIYRAQISGGSYGRIAETEDTGYLDENREIGRTFFYVVTAVDEHGVESEYSNEASAEAGAPSNEIVYLPLVLSEHRSGPMRVLWDESHQSAKTLSWARAQSLVPDHPDWAYCGRLAADLASEFDLVRNADASLTAQLLSRYDAVILPSLDAGLTQAELQALEQFMNAGGGVLILGGSEWVSDEFAIDKGIDLDGRVIFATDGDGDYEVTDFANHAAVAGVARLVTNWGGSLSVRSPAVVLATSPSTSVFRDMNGNFSYDPGEPTGPFDLAAAYESGSARLVVQSGSPYQDHGYESRDNMPLMRAFLRWLAGPR